MVAVASKDRINQVQFTITVFVKLKRRIRSPLRPLLTVINEGGFTLLNLDVLDAARWREFQIEGGFTILNLDVARWREFLILKEVFDDRTETFFRYAIEAII